MFIRIPYYDAEKINILASKSCKNKYSDPNKIGNNLTEKICQCCFHFNSPGKWRVSFCHHLMSVVSVFVKFSYFKLLLEKYRLGNQTGSDVPYEFPHKYCFFGADSS